VISSVIVLLGNASELFHQTKCQEPVGLSGMGFACWAVHEINPTDNSAKHADANLYIIVMLFLSYLSITFQR